MLFELAYQCFRYLCSCLEANNGATLVKTFFENNTKKSKVIKRWHTRESWSLMKTSLPIKILTLGSFFFFFLPFPDSLSCEEFYVLLLA